MDRAHTLGGYLSVEENTTLPTSVFAPLIPGPVLDLLTTVPPAHGSAPEGRRTPPASEAEPGALFQSFIELSF